MMETINSKVVINHEGYGYWEKIVNRAAITGYDVNKVKRRARELPLRLYCGPII